GRCFLVRLGDDWRRIRLSGGASPRRPEHPRPAAGAFCARAGGAPPQLQQAIARTSTVTLIEQIAEKIVAIRYDDLPKEAVEWAKAAILDTVGVTLAGAGEECARIVEKTLAVGGSHGNCLIFGSDRRIGPLDAALINGTAA